MYKTQINELRNEFLGIKYLAQLIVPHIEHDMKKSINPKFPFYWMIFNNLQWNLVVNNVRNKLMSYVMNYLYQITYNKQWCSFKIFIGTPNCHRS